MLDLLHHLGVMPVRGEAHLQETCGSCVAGAPYPHIPGLTRDLIALTEFGHGAFLQLVLKDKSKLLFHNTARFPWHALVLHALVKVLAVSGMLPVCFVRDVPGPYPIAPPTLPPMFFL